MFLVGGSIFVEIDSACLDSPKDFSEIVFVVCSQFSPINFDVTAVTSGKGSRERQSTHAIKLLIFSE